MFNFTFTSVEEARRELVGRMRAAGYSMVNLAYGKIDTATDLPCSGTRGVATHTNVNNGGRFVATIGSCECCQDGAESGSTPMIVTRCAILNEYY